MFALFLCVYQTNQNINHLKVAHDTNKVQSIMKTKIFTLFFALVACVGNMFAEIKIGDLYYNLDDGNKTAEVAPSSYPGDIVIPASVEYNSVTYSVTSIGDGAFFECTGLTSVEIPNSVTSIGAAAFLYCTGLTSIDVATDNPNYSSSGGVLFNKGKTTLVAYPGGKQGAYTIPNSVTSIEEGAFYGCTGLTSITIPNSVTSIGDGAFRGCSGLASLTCMATNPPSMGADVFFSVDCSQIPLYVPVGSIDAYRTAYQWEYFTNILPITAKETETNTVKTEPTTNSVEVTWPVVAGAYTYEIVIKDKSGNVVCTLVFNAQGQLQSIAFNAPGRDGAPQQTQGAGFSFTTTGLTAGTSYDVTITAKDSNGATLDTQTVSFTTDGTQGIDDINATTKSQKIVRDNQVLILRGDKTYTVTGQEIK